MSALDLPPYIYDAHADVRTLWLTLALLALVALLIGRRDR
jgi:hypothetical protein